MLMLSVNVTLQHCHHMKQKCAFILYKNTKVLEKMLNFGKHIP